MRVMRRSLSFIRSIVCLALLLSALSSCGSGKTDQGPIGTGDVIGPVTTNSIAVNIVSISKASAGGTVQVPIAIDRTEDVAGLDVTVAYDSSVLAFQSLSEGDAAKGFLFEKSVSSGSVRIVSAGTQTMAAGGGTVVTLSFAVAAVPSGTSTNITFQSLALYSASAARLSNVNAQGGTVIVE